MTIDTEPLSDQVFHQFLDLLRFSRQYARQIMAEQGIKPRQFSVLRYLLDSGPATVGQIQMFLHRSASTTSTLIAQLEEMGFVTRTRSELDNRVVIVELTNSGQEIAINTPLGGLPLLRRQLARMPEARLGEIQSVLTQIAGLMESTGAE
jgi:DNA-binding MarR family transcriptional regulator